MRDLASRHDIAPIRPIGTVGITFCMRRACQHRRISHRREHTRMAMIRFRLIGSRADADTVIVGLHGMNGIEHIEEIDTLMPDMRDDSSSSESVSDSEAHVYCIEVEAASDSLADSVRDSAEVLAHACEAGIEFVDEF